MKELSIEEKAKEYDGNFEVYAELVNRLEEVKDAILKHNYGIAIDVLYKPYPVFKVITHSEFKESDDEEIRKEMLEYCYKRMDNEFPSITIHQVKRWLAWLEKRGEQKAIIIDVDKMVDEFAHTEVKGYGMPAMIEVDAYRKGVNDALRLSLNLEKQSWQKPTDEEMKTILRTEYEKGRADAIAEFQQEWSKEDKTMLCYMEGHLEYLKNDKGYSSSEDQIMLKRQLDWLKSLKYRVQPQQEWSEEDNINFKRLLYFLDGGNLMQDHKIKLFIWVESLKERFTWKPSDEQIEILDMVLTNKSMDDNIARILRDLIEQLHKLREG